MKPTPIHLIGAVILALAAGLTYQIKVASRDSVVDNTVGSGNAGQQESGDIPTTREDTRPASAPPRHPSREVTENHAARRPATGDSNKAPHSLPDHSISAPAAQHSHHPSGRGPAADGWQEDSPHVSPTARTIQLAGNFQLPAALMEATSPAEPKSDEVRTPVENATQAIVDAFYRELAKLPPDDLTSDPEAVTAQGQLVENIIIGPSAETEAIRHHADELYRTLFGNEAFSRNGMDSALEVRLPEASDEAAR